LQKNTKNLKLEEIKISTDANVSDYTNFKFSKSDAR
jgi:hypothetical protein